MAAVVVTTAAVWALGLADRGVSIVGAVPQSLPPFTVPSFDFGLLTALFVPALLISVIGFVESISVAQTLAAKKRQRNRPRPGTDRPWRRQHRRGLHRGLPGHRRLRALGREFRCGRRDAGRRAPTPPWALPLRRWR